MFANNQLLDPDLAALLPLGAEVDDEGCLVLGGVGVRDLTARFGTPLYVYDEETIRASCRAYLDAFVRPHPSNRANRVHYAAKAYLAPWLCRVIRQEGLGLDLVSGGELHVALTSGVPASEIRLHGNNKLPTELRDAVAAGVGRIVIDNRDELRLLSEIAATARRRVPILLRLSPGVEAHTHEYLQTGLLDSKFGLPIAAPDDPLGGDALHAVREALDTPALDVRGYHAHVGTGLFDPTPIAETMRRLLRFARRVQAESGYWPAELSPGGGLGIPYVRGERAPSVQALAAAIMATLGGVEPAPAIGVEPGRSIVGRAGVAIYTVGARKRIEGIRRYISVDGGMADNIRPALYQATYTALAATRMTEPPSGPVTVAGRYCESGDILVRDVPLPPLGPGDLLAIPAAGAYCLPMSSAYNAAMRPAVVVVRDGTARLVQRRGALADLMAYDVEEREGEQ